MKIQITKEMDISEVKELAKAKKENRKFIIKNFKIYPSNAVRVNLELETIRNESVIERDNIIRNNYTLLERLKDYLEVILELIKEYL